MDSINVFLQLLKVENLGLLLSYMGSTLSWISFTFMNNL